MRRLAAAISRLFTKRGQKARRKNDTSIYPMF